MKRPGLADRQIPMDKAADQHGAGEWVEIDELVTGTKALELNLATIA